MKTASGKGGRGDRGGFSLLEVLIACGVLVIGLAGIAAIMPAAGARLGEASAQDRANSAVANAFGEIKARGLVSKTLFQTGASYSGTAAAVFGATLAPLQSLAVPVPNVVFVTGTAFGARIDTGDRGFYLEDDTVYAAATDDPPQNSFVNGVREFNRGVCWGATVAPAPWLQSPETMKLAEVSVAVFRKPPTEVEDIQLQQIAGSVYQVTSPAGFDDGSRRTFLKPCGYVLSVPLTSGTVAPEWLSVNSSWGKDSTDAFGNPIRIQQVSFSKPMTAPNVRTIGFGQLITVQKQLIKVP